MKGTVTYKKPKKDDRGIDVTIEWEAEGTEGAVTGNLKRTIA